MKKGVFLISIFFRSLVLTLIIILNSSCDSIFSSVKFSDGQQSIRGQDIQLTKDLTVDGEVIGELIDSGAIEEAEHGRDPSYGNLVSFCLIDPEKNKEQRHGCAIIRYPDDEYWMIDVHWIQGGDVWVSGTYRVTLIRTSEYPESSEATTYGNDMAQMTISSFELDQVPGLHPGQVRVNRPEGEIILPIVCLDPEFIDFEREEQTTQ